MCALQIYVEVLTAWDFEYGFIWGRREGGLCRCNQGKSEVTLN